MTNILPFPARRAIGGLARPYPQHEPPMAHEDYYQTALDTVVKQACEAGFAMRKAMEPAERDIHLKRGVEALKVALVAAISASGCRNEDREIYAALVNSKG